MAKAVLGVDAVAMAQARAMTVTTWPSYLLNRIPVELRQRMSKEAEQEQMSVADVVRQALCEHYGLDCDLRSTSYSMRDRGSSSLLLRLQPEVFGALSKESIKSRRTMRDIVLQVLESHYQ